MFEAYLDGLPSEQRDALLAVIEHVATLVPDATEGRSYGVPAFRYQGKPLLGFAIHKGHLGLYPFSPAVLTGVADRLGSHSHSKGSIRFSPDHPVPSDVLTDLVLGRMREIDAPAS
jgi:uncharacterized protein YdhG (YjbR/CyaY superfamily)